MPALQRQGGHALGQCPAGFLISSCLGMMVDGCGTVSTETKSETSQSSEDGKTFTTFTFVPICCIFLSFPLTVPLLASLSFFLAAVVVGMCKVTVWGTWVCMRKG